MAGQRTSQTQESAPCFASPSSQQRLSDEVQRPVFQESSALLAPVDPKKHRFHILTQRTKRALRRLLNLREEIQEIEEELSALMEASGQTLATASGCGTVIAAELIGEIGDVARSRSPGALAKYAGCAPREHSSGKTIRSRPRLESETERTISSF